MNQMIVSLLNTLGLKSDPQTTVAFRNTVEEIAQARIAATIPAPFASSVQMQLAQESTLEGQINELDTTQELPVGFFTAYIGIIFYVDVSRGTEWGAIPVSVTTNEDSVFTDIPSNIAIAEGKTNTLVQIAFDPVNAVADTEHFIEFTIGDGSFSQVRTLTVNVVADPA
jgi:hypothetical protein